MSNYKTHIFVGILIAVVFSFVTGAYKQLFNNTLEVLVLPVVIVLYSILPDIDTRTSKISHVTRVFGLVLLLATTLLSLKMITIAIILVLIVLEFLKHRKFVHTFMAALLVSLPLLLIGAYAFVFGFISYASHLVLDRRFRLY